MGTPHRGGKGVELGVFLANFLKVANFNTRPGLIKGLKKNSIDLFDDTLDFSQLVGDNDITVVTLIETEMMEFGRCFKVRSLVRDWILLVGLSFLILLHLRSDRR